MPFERHTAEGIIHELREAEIALAKGPTTGEVVHRFGETEQTNDRSRKEYGGMKLDRARRPARAPQRSAIGQSASGSRSSAVTRRPPKFWVQ